MQDVIELSKELIRFPSVTPEQAGCLDFIEELLSANGFSCERMKFGEVDNLYAKYDNGGENFCFAGHIDVVPPGELARWTNSPFEPVIRDGNLYGRGTSDMKAAIAAQIIAAIQFAGAKKKGTISFLLTSDEEGPGVDGTKKVLEALAARGEKINACIVGEPTNPNKVGEMIKIGRRGSMNCHLHVQGKQGHAAYPENTDNPVKKLINILHALQNHRLDEGNEHFTPSNLEVVSFDVGNPTSNIVPNHATALLNIRFNNFHTSESLIKWIEGVVGDDPKVTLSFHVSGESFLTQPGRLSEITMAAVKEVCGEAPVLSTTGGTSDARFIYNYAEVLEFGSVNKTAHQIDEHVSVEGLYQLEKIYAGILQRFFA